MCIFFEDFLTFLESSNGRTFFWCALLLLGYPQKVLTDETVSNGWLHGFSLSCKGLILLVVCIVFCIVLNQFSFICNINVLHSYLRTSVNMRGYFGDWTRKIFEYHFRAGRTASIRIYERSKKIFWWKEYFTFREGGTLSLPANPIANNERFLWKCSKISKSLKNRV